MGAPGSRAPASENILPAANASQSNLHSTQRPPECNVAQMFAVQAQSGAEQYRPWPLPASGQSGWTPNAVPSMPQEQPGPVNNTCRRAACQAPPQTRWNAQPRTGRNNRQCKDKRTQTKRVSGEMDDRPQPCGEPRWTWCETNAALPPTIPATKTAMKSPNTLEKGENEGGAGGNSAMSADARPPRDEQSLQNEIRQATPLRCTKPHECDNIAAQTRCASHHQP